MLRDCSRDENNMEDFQIPDESQSTLSSGQSAALDHCSVDTLKSFLLTSYTVLQHYSHGRDEGASSGNLESLQFQSGSMHSKLKRDLKREGHHQEWSLRLNLTQHGKPHQARTPDYGSGQFLSSSNLATLSWVVVHDTVLR